jgi:glycosyltransferase involved in cell wall biosynthesis
VTRVLMLGWEFPPHISGGLGTACQGLTRGLAHAGVDVLFMVPRAFGDEDGPWMSIVGANQVVRRREQRAEERARSDERSEARAHGLPQRPRAAARAAERSDVLHEARAARDLAVHATRVAGAEDDAAVGSDEDVGPSTEVDPGAAGRVEIRTVDSPLSPYLDAAAYRDRLAQLVRDRAARAALLGPLGLLDDQVDADGQVGASAAPRVPGDAPGWQALAERIGAAVRQGVRFETETFELWGGYGAGLFDEVARFAVAASEVALQEPFDLVHAHDWITYPAGVAAARARGVPLVCHLHATEYDRTGDSPDGRVLAIERMGLAAADLVVCVSHYTARIAMRRYGVPESKIRVVHNAVTQKEQREQWHQDRTIADPLVLFLGRVTFQKGPDYFLEAAARVVRVRPRTRFVISGSGDMLPDMVMRSARLGLSDHVFFTGFLRGKDVERMYAMADLYVMPSVSEPFGITPLEALALDVPVIVSRQSGVSEVLANALKVDFWDVDELANKILATLEYEPLRRQLVDSGREEVRRMRWELRGEVLERIYAELLA